MVDVLQFSVLCKGHQHDETVSQKSAGQTGGNHKVAFIGVLGIDCLCEQVGEKCGGDYATVDQNVVRHDIPPFWMMSYWDKVLKREIEKTIENQVSKRYTSSKLLLLPN